ncbi:unnamed protein product [Anisakis simplex]|uniref:ornithine decarboxylase n=1 Tax=Anisakis simplex TaxID=6269 RepID=A0A0M3K9N0_ANISI|nr:unnamed protein product [Anisakis simplex]
MQSSNKCYRGTDESQSTVLEKDDFSSIVQDDHCVGSTTCRQEVLYKRVKLTRKRHQNNTRKFETYAEKKLNVLNSTKSSMEMARGIASSKSQRGQDDAFYVMNVNTVIRRLMEWKTNLPRVEPFYAVKCNDDPVLMKVLASFGCGFDVASKVECTKAIKLVPKDKIVYANPIKTNSFIKRARELDIGMMTFDTVEELDKVARLYPKAKLILRIATNDSSAKCRLSMKFGCDALKDGPHILKAACERGIDVIGIAFHVGSGCNDPTTFQEAIMESRALFDIGTSFGHEMKLLDIGGGFPGGEAEIGSFENMARLIGSCLDEYFPASEGVRIIAEPGRFFAHATFSLVTNVIGVKKVGAERFDDSGGTNNDDIPGFMYYMNDGVYGSFNCIFFDHTSPEGQPLFSKEGEDCFPCTIWGPTCDGLDQVEKRRMMPALSIGDWLYYEEMGAYTCSAASTFNGFAKPRVYYFADENTWKLIADST